MYNELNDRIVKTNNIKKLNELKTTINVSLNRKKISSKDSNSLLNKINKKIYMLEKVNDSDRSMKIKDADYTIKKISGKEQYDVLINDKKVKTFGSLVDAQKYIRDFKLGRVKDSIPEKIQKVNDANIRVDIDKISDYLWTWTDIHAIGNPISEIRNELMDEAYETGIRDRKEAHEYVKKNYKKHLDKIYSDLKKSVDKKLRDGYNASVKAFESL